MANTLLYLLFSHKHRINYNLTILVIFFIFIFYLNKVELDMLNGNQSTSEGLCRV